MDYCCSSKKHPFFFLTGKCSKDPICETIEKTSQQKIDLQKFLFDLETTLQNLVSEKANNADMIASDENPTYVI